MVLAIVWSLSLNPNGIFQSINTMITYLAPPMTCVFLFGIFWRRASSVAAVTTLLLGAMCGLSLFAINQVQPAWWTVIVEQNHFDFLLQGVALFIICSLVMLLVSWRWPHHHTAQSSALVWSTPWEALSSPGWPGLANYKFVAALLVASLVTIYTIFK
jgi:SSS family solute:Na+ symporter